MVAAKMTCPPPGWDRCGTTWPPAVGGHCCSSAGYFGDTTAHCSNGGIDAVESGCCTTTPSGRLSCDVPCDDPPTTCTGLPEIDAVLHRSKVGCAIGLNRLNTVYTWQGFCDAVSEFNAIPGTRRLFLGEAGDGGKLGLVNIAGLLAQSMWESGGDAPFSACDENNYRHSPTASCTQRSDGARYDALNDQPWACQVDPQMTMTAVTAAPWASLGPMSCTPGTATEGCCWWGRGAIQTTGPNNYGLLQREVMSKIGPLRDRGIDLCRNPEAICEHQDTKWLGAIFYWANNVQGFTDPGVKERFHDSLRAFVEGGFSRDASRVDGVDFVSGTGGLVNNGHWTATPHHNAKRVAFFDEIMELFKAAGMDSAGGGTAGTSPPPPPADCFEDACGICGGDGSSCAGCDGVPNSGVVPDACGICGGEATSCDDTSNPEDTPETPAASCQGPWQQCGGQTWLGETCCTAGHECVVDNDWYSQCRPVSASPSGTPSTTSGDGAGGSDGTPTASCAETWGQCGGLQWQGPSCCESGATCIQTSAWYHQCKPVRRLRGHTVGSLA